MDTLIANVRKKQNVYFNKVSVNLSCIYSRQWEPVIPTPAFEEDLFSIEDETIAKSMLADSMTSPPSVSATPLYQLHETLPILAPIRVVTNQV